MLYMCVKEFVVPKYDDDGFTTNDYIAIEKDSVWELNDDTRHIGGDHHLDKNETLEWVEISNETLESYFVELPEQVEGETK